MNIPFAPAKLRSGSIVVDANGYLRLTVVVVRLGARFAPLGYLFTRHQKAQLNEAQLDGDISYEMILCLGWRASFLHQRAAVAIARSRALINLAHTLTDPNPGNRIDWRRSSLAAKAAAETGRGAAKEANKMIFVVSILLNLVVPHTAAGK